MYCIFLFREKLIYLSLSNAGLSLHRTLTLSVFSILFSVDRSLLGNIFLKSLIACSSLMNLIGILIVGFMMAFI